MTMQTVLRPYGGSTYDVAYDATAGGVKNATAFTESAIRIKPTTDCYIKFGGSAVTVSSSDYDMHLTGGTEYDLSTGGSGYVAIIRVSNNGTAYINQWTHKAL